MWAIDTKKSNVDTFYVSMGVIKFVHVKLFCINKFKRGFQVYAILLLTIIGFLNKLRYAKPVYKIFTKFNDSENTRGWLVCELSQSINFFFFFCNCWAISAHLWRLYKPIHPPKQSIAIFPLSYLNMLGWCLHNTNQNNMNFMKQVSFTVLLAKERYHLKNMAKLIQQCVAFKSKKVTSAWEIMHFWFG